MHYSAGEINDDGEFQGYLDQEEINAAVVGAAETESLAPSSDEKFSVADAHFIASVGKQVRLESL